MKKAMTVLLALVVCALPLSAMTGCTKRADELWLYMPGEYMDEEQLFPAFEQWYAEQTGKKVKVRMELFNTLEEMMMRMELEQPDYDLICPSDYAIEEMIDKGWVQAIDRERVKVEEVIESDYLKLSKAYDPDLKYSVPYIYGTYGLLYNIKKTGKQLDSWASIFTGEFAGDIYQKKSVREFYGSACIYAKSSELSAASNGFTDYGAEYSALLNRIFSDTSAAMADAAESVLKEQKKHLKKYDDEDGKFLMAQNNGTAGLFWSCDAGYVMNDYEDESGNPQPGNPDLWYAIPKEGSNVYIDAFVVSNYAANSEAAQYFLEFLCREENAIIASEYCGAISPVKSAYQTLYKQYAQEKQAGEGIFAGKAAGWGDMYLDMMFPSAETLSRCAMNRKFENLAEKQRIDSLFADLTNG